MPQVPGAKTGFDYGRLKNHIQATGAQKDNNALFQSLNELSDAARTFQGFIEQLFPQLDGSLNNLYAFVQGVIKELNEVRNNSKFSVSLLNTVAQTSTGGPVTFDTILYNDGLMFDPLVPNQIVANANAQYFVSGIVNGIKSATPGTYLQNLLIAGVDESRSFVIFLKNDGSYLQYNLPSGLSTREGDIRVSLTHNRIYLTVDEGGTGKLLILDGNGNVINLIDPADIDSDDMMLQGLYAFEDKLWVSIAGNLQGEIWEFDYNGNFIEVIAFLSESGGKYLAAGQNFRRFTHYIYFASDRNGLPLEASESGVYRYDMAAGGDCELLVDVLNNDIFGFAVSSQGNFLVTLQDSDINRYSADGELQQTYAGTGNQLEGLCYSRDERFFFCGGDSPEAVYKFNVYDGFETIFTTPAMDRALAIGDLDCCFGAGTRIQVSVNGIPQFSTSSENYAGLIDVLRNDVITLEVLSVDSVEIFPTFQMHRVTYSQHDKESGRNIK